MSDGEHIEVRRNFSLSQLDDLRKAFAADIDTDKWSSLCIYSTGSFARLEGSRFSDIDLFFIHASHVDAVPRIEKTLLDAQIISISRDLGYPEFSGDGQYLEIHYASSLTSNLGSPSDDYDNTFTARQLLLLESQPLFNEAVYTSALHETVEAYFRDYHDHALTFRPIFLLNDVLRFWKTLCLNYENRRGRADADQATKAKHHAKNLKLQFSRLLTCYSMVLALVVEPTIDREQVVQAVRRTPMQRFSEAASRLDAVDSFARAQLAYDWFLGITNQSADDLAAWILVEENRDAAFSKAREFKRSVFEVLRRANDRNPDLFQALVV